MVCKEGQDEANAGKSLAQCATEVGLRKMANKLQNCATKANRLDTTQKCGATSYIFNAQLRRVECK